MEIKAKEKEDIINKTFIEWVRNQDGSPGFTSNPVRGECPVGCPYCYVKLFRIRYGWHKDIRFYSSELEAIRKRKKPAGIFVGSTIELFHDKTIQYMPAIMETIQACPQHRFYLLTKQYQNLIKFSPFPENCWVGITATSYKVLDESIALLWEIEASVKFISFEPLLDWDCPFKPEIMGETFQSAGIDWLIIGACTGSKYGLLELCQKWNISREVKTSDLALMPWEGRWTLQPQISWVGEIVEAGVPVFLKENLKGITLPASQIVKYHNLATTTVCVDQEKGLWRLNDLRQEIPNG